MFVDGTRADAEIPGDLLGLFVGRDARQAGAFAGGEAVDGSLRHGFGPRVITGWAGRRRAPSVPACTTGLPPGDGPGAVCLSQGFEVVLARAMVNAD